ncbi:MAG: T9SS C-terminal target domain-containing protein [Bacteroidetes bacterium]|nr:MAG: T9SS C-terminal target domain-containing protein [Bacteroidota bacterium]REK06535.1 MAG: T9SS C-terminal target domain-containing protein [Bacteroidota bacterium]REK33301.1 MAG: T9SS C-terminal target domain-containing protein [Bacteroidota bacterium]REK49701.1 MAG: T9SS C-terminal target domain-containing protein [Bacteroidota bacterium]
MAKTFTKKLYGIWLSLLILFSMHASAQFNSGLSYTMTVGAYQAGWTAGTLSGLNNANDAQTAVISFGGPTFPYAGQNYSGFVLSSNGWIALTNLAAASPSPVPTSLPANNLATGSGVAGVPLIAPLWDDLQSTVQYTLTAANLTVRWNGTRWQVGSATTTVIDARLTFATGVIEFNFANTAFTPLNPSASMGLTGVCAGDYYSVKPSYTSGQIDSTVDNNITVKPMNLNFIWTPSTIYNDVCVNSVDLGVISASSCSSPVTFSNIMASNSGVTPAMCTADNRDVWFRFTKPAGVTDIRVSTDFTPACNPLAGTTVQVYSGTCGALTSLGCSTSNLGASNSKGVVEVLGRPQCTSEVLYVRVTGDGDLSGRFMLCAMDRGTISYAPGAGSVCGNAIPVCSLPFSATGLNTSGTGNDYDSTMACLNPFMNGNDFVFSYTPATTTCVRVAISNTGLNSYPGVFILNNCPTSGGAACLGAATANSNGATINSATLTGGVTYYIVVANNNNGGSTSSTMPFDISVTNLGAIGGANDDCVNAINLGTINNGQACTWSADYTTQCMTPSPAAGYPLPSCGGLINNVTGDVWFRFTANFTGSLLINTRRGSSNFTTDAAMAVYAGGSCGSWASVYSCDDNSASNGMPSLSLPVISGTTYWIRVWTRNPETTGTFNICVSSACVPANDQPCGAVTVPLGGTVQGTNLCASATNEPPNSAQCPADGGTINTVWYKAVVPASGQLKIRTHPLSLTDTQIQAFTFAAGCANAATTFVSRGCNNDGPACSGGINLYSDLTVTGLTPGDTLFVAVDGRGSSTGNFEITIMDGTQTQFPPIAGQDCAFPTQVCNSSNIVVADPGWQNFGNVCDMPSGTGTCWGVGERNSVWYQFTVNPGGVVQFSVNTVASADIDFIVWDVTGQSNPCAAIQTASLSPTRCNYAGALASTGIRTGGGTGFDNSITVGATPQTFLLLLNNWNSSLTAGYTLDWMGTPISSSPSTLTWSGTTDTNFGTNTNWGDCVSSPSCAVDAIIVPTANGRQPVVSSNRSVRNLTINAGASLRILTGFTLSVCGNFANYGTLIADPGSTVQFIDVNTQNVNGTLIGANGFSNMTVTKGGGSVILNTDIEVRENFITSSATSVFNINGRTMYSGGNFTNNNGIGTFTGIANSTVEFNGTGAQTFTNSNGSIILNRVRMNKTGSTPVNLIGANSIMNIDSFLILNTGKIVTTSLAALEVNVRNNQTAAVTPGNNNSYVEGKLRRKLWTGSGPSITGSYDFPVGHVAKGYQRANITFPASVPSGVPGTLIGDLLAYFTPFPGAPPASGPVATECIVSTYDSMPIFDNGYWTILRPAGSPIGGIYNTTLYNNNVTNVGMPGNRTTVAVADLPSDPSLPPSWYLNGVCQVASTAAMTVRNLMNSPPASNTAFNLNYATAQTFQQVLPISLLSFTADPVGDEVLCKWVTSSETNNDYFQVEKSLNGYDGFEIVGIVNGFGAGTSTTVRNYGLTDKEQCTGITYYRLKQVDINGEFSFSDVVAVNCKKTWDDIKLYPNPASNSVSITFYETSQEIITIQIVDYTGRIVKEEIHEAIRGYNTLNVSINNLSSGLYYVRIKDKGKSSSHPERVVRMIKN